MVSADDGKKHSLVIRDVTEDDKGLYTVEAETPEGEVITAFHIIPTGSPDKTSDSTGESVPPKEKNRKKPFYLLSYFFYHSKSYSLLSLLAFLHFILKSQFNFFLHFITS